MNKEIDLDKAKESGVLELKGAVLFLPEDLEKFEGKGKWALHVIEGKLVKLPDKE